MLHGGFSLDYVRLPESLCSYHCVVTKPFNDDADEVGYHFKKN